MSINKKIIVTAVAGLALGVSSCKKYLDVNTNPNIAPVATVATLLPAAQLYVGSAMGVDMQIYGSIWSQHWTQSPNGKEYVPFEQYDPAAAAFNMPWGNLYAGAENFHQVAKLSEEQHKGQYLAISLLMQAYTFQVLADGWGDVPYSGALRGQYADGHVVNPSYDSQRVVYRGILTLIDSATALINGGGSKPGADDLIYKGDMSKWKKFANTLKLRVILRIAKADPVYARNMMTILYSTNPQFISEGDDARIVYGASMANNNPLYSELSSMQMGGVQQLAGSKTVIDSMNSNNDPRGMVFFQSVPTLGLIGIKQGEYDIALPNGSFSIPSANTGADAGNAASGAAAVMLLSSWESAFLQAEAVVRGLAVGDDALWFKAGIHASFNYYGSALLAATNSSGNTAYDVYVNGATAPATPAAYWAKYPVTGTAEEKLRHIITQKWFSMCGSQGFEAWTEWRRTGYPDFLIHPRNSHIGLLFPERFLYPSSEEGTNSKFPGSVPVTTAVWWDKL